MSDAAGRLPIVVMGVSGAGKSTVGAAIASELGGRFIDGDDLHPPANKEKMRLGKALTDDDRLPWLDAVGERLAGRDGAVSRAVVACSALKRAYRTRLLNAAPATVFVHLHGTRELLESRLGERVHEYMPATLLDSQLATLEPPAPDERAITVGIDGTPDEVAAAAVGELRRRWDIRPDTR